MRTLGICNTMIYRNKHFPQRQVQQGPPAQPTSRAQNRIHGRGELIDRRSPARARTASAAPSWLLHEDLLLAPQRKRSNAPDPACEANTKHTRRYGRHASFKSRTPWCTSTACMGAVGTVECGRVGGIGANTTALWGHYLKGWFPLSVFSAYDT